MFGNKLIMDGHKPFPLLYVSIEHWHFQCVTFPMCDISVFNFFNGIGFGIEKIDIEKVSVSVLEK